MGLIFIVLRGLIAGKPEFIDSTTS
jgi:hypothetical protein